VGAAVAEPEKTAKAVVKRRENCILNPILGGERDFRA
jgi:hypothetical protein